MKKQKNHEVINGGIYEVDQSIGKHSEAHLLAYSFGSQKGKHKNKVVIPIKGTEARLHPESAGIRTRTRPN